MEDFGEHEQSCHNGWMSADDAKLGLVVTEGCAQCDAGVSNINFRLVS